MAGLSKLLGTYGKTGGKGKAMWEPGAYGLSVIMVTKYTNDGSHIFVVLSFPVPFPFLVLKFPALK